jgi:hypothetical protein
MTQTEALRLALEALEEYTSVVTSVNDPNTWTEVADGGKPAREAITAIKAALEEKDEPWEKFCDSHCVWTDHHPDCKLAKDEPVAWMYPDDLKRFETSEAYAQAYSIEMVSPTQGETVPLYTTPPQRKPLTIEQPKVRTGNCLRVGVCASEGHKIQPQRTWVGLTDEEIAEVEDEFIVDYRIPAGSAWNFARAIEAKLKEKSNA